MSTDSSSRTRAVFERMTAHWLSDSPLFTQDLLTEDVVVEMPFAPPGARRRIDGRAGWLDFAKASAAVLPVRFERCDVTALHETADPNVIVVEYELTGTVTTTNLSASAAFIGVLTVRDGRIAQWREYQNVPAMAAALGRQPDRLDGLSVS